MNDPAPPDAPPLAAIEILPPSCVPAGRIDRAVAKATAYAEKSLSENTKRAYEADWRLFSGWCADMAVPALPASPVVVAGYLASLAEKLGRSGLRRRLAAIAHHHRRAGQTWEPGHPALRATLRASLPPTASQPAPPPPLPPPKSRKCSPSAQPTAPACAIAPCC